jgi:hypothetical protein
LVASTLFFSVCTALSAQLTREAAIAKTEAILEHLQEGKTAEVVKEFDPKMAQAVPEEKLQTAWASLVAKFGSFKGIKERREGQVKGRQAVELILAFEKETVVQRAVFEMDGKVSGLVFQPLNMAVLPGE